MNALCDPAVAETMQPGQDGMFAGNSTVAEQADTKKLYPSFVSVFGQHHAATPESKNLKAYNNIAFEQITVMAANPVNVAKDHAQWIVLITPMDPDTRKSQVLKRAVTPLTNWRHNRKGPDYIKFSRKSMYLKEDLDLFIESHRIKLTA